MELIHRESDAKMDFAGWVSCHRYVFWYVCMCIDARVTTCMHVLCLFSDLEMQMKAQKQPTKRRRKSDSGSEDLESDEGKFETKANSKINN